MGGPIIMGPLMGPHLGEERQTPLNGPLHPHPMTLLLLQGLRGPQYQYPLQQPLQYPLQYPLSRLLLHRRRSSRGPNPWGAPLLVRRCRVLLNGEVTLTIQGPLLIRRTHLERDRALFPGPLMQA